MSRFDNLWMLCQAKIVVGTKIQDWLAVTDANVLLGRIPVDHFPQVFGPEANEALDTDVVRARFAALAEQISTDTGTATAAETVAEGFLTVAVESMANAIRKITIERGEDVRDFVLCSFGGAAGQHACKVAEVLDMKKVWLHPMAGVLDLIVEHRARPQGHGYVEAEVDRVTAEH